MNKKKYNPMKRINTQNRMLMTETIGTGLAFSVAGNQPQALKAATMGTSLAGTSSLAYGAGNVLGSLKMLESRKRKR